MKIAYISQVFPPTGFAAAINTYRIVKGLVERGHELSVFCPKSVPKYVAQLELQNENEPYLFDVYYSFPTPIPLSVTLPHLFNALRVLRHQFDLLITQFHLFHLASFTGLPLKTLKGIPWVVKIHDMIPDPALHHNVSRIGFVNRFYGMSLTMCYGIFLKNIGKKAEKLFVLTTELRNLLLANGYFADRVAVIPNGVDTKIFSPSISKGDSINKKTILYIGSMMPEDGLDCLVKAFSLLNPKKELHLTMIGDGSQRLQLVELVKKLNLERKVTFHRYVPHKLLPGFIRAAYVGIGPLRLSPANYYTIPTKIVEYSACGKPVISSPVSKDVLRDESTGFVVKEVSPKNVAEKLSILLENERLTRDMGKNARQLVIERFEQQRIIDEIEREIQSLESHRLN